MSSNWNPQAVKWNLDNFNPDDSDYEESIKFNRIVESNITELASFAVLFSAGWRKTKLRGVVSLKATDKEANSFSYPFDFHIGKKLSYLSKEDFHTFNDYDPDKEFLISILSSNNELLLLQRVAYPQSLNTYKPVSNLIINEDYTLKMDNDEISFSTEPLFKMSKKKYLNGEYVDCLKLLNTLIDKNPYYSRAHCSRAIVYKRFGDNRYALASYFDALNANPDNWRVYHNLALLFGEIGDTYSSILSKKYTIECIFKNPYFIDAYRILQLNATCIDRSYIEKIIHFGIDINKENHENVEILEELLLIIDESWKRTNYIRETLDVDLHNSKFEEKSNGR